MCVWSFVHIMCAFIFCTPSHSLSFYLLYFQDSYDVSKYHNPKGHYGVFDAVADSLDDSDSLDDYDYDSFDDEEEFTAMGKSRKRSRGRRRSR